MQSVNNPCTDNVVCLFAVLHSELFTSCEKTHTERWKVRNNVYFSHVFRHRAGEQLVPEWAAPSPHLQLEVARHLPTFFIYSCNLSWRHPVSPYCNFFYFHHFSRLCKLNICCVLIRTGRGNPPEVSSFLFPAEVLRTVLCEL